MHDKHQQPGRPRSPRHGSERGGLVTRILCVEDNEDNIYLVKMRLEMIEGFDITVARDGRKP
jgi:hypothetical protein